MVARSNIPPRVIRPSQPLAQVGTIRLAKDGAQPTDGAEPAANAGEELGAGIKLALPAQVTGAPLTAIEDAPTMDGTEDPPKPPPVITEGPEAGPEAAPEEAGAQPEPGPEPEITALSEKTRAEMEAGRNHIKQHQNVTIRRTAAGVVELSDRTLQEMKAGQKRLEHHEAFEKQRAALGD